MDKSEVKLFWLAWKPTSNASGGRAGHLIMVVGGSSPGCYSPNVVNVR